MESARVDSVRIQAALADQFETYNAELVDLFRQSLRETLFTNRAEMRPSDIRQLANEAAAELSKILRQAETGGTPIGERLAQSGLSEQSVLGLCTATRQFTITHIENGFLAPSLNLVDANLNQVIRDFIQFRERTILIEQEQIRSALQKALSRYTVEIKEVQEMAQRATEASNFKTHLIAQMSHELRTPVGALMGMAEILQQNIYGPLSPAQQDIVRRIIDNSQHLNQVFTQLLDQSRLESGQLQLHEEEFSPRSVIQTVYSSQLPAAVRKQLSLELEVTRALPTILLGDKVRIMQILTNLVVNAIKYTQAGHIEIRAGVDGPDQWFIEVSDTGIGIPPEAQADIFEPFRQLEGSNGRLQEGVGLGLSIVKQLTLAMKGSISLTSELGRGSLFRICLPMHKV
jgi:signal transduction histidine kinase